MPRGFISDLQKSLIGGANRDFASRYLGLFTFAQLMYYITCFVDPGYVRVSPRYQVVLSVTVKLFKTFCCIMYCCQIWSQYEKDTVRKLQVGYNHAFRRIMKYDSSASGMFVANGVMSFNEIWRKSLYNFRQRVTKSNNIIVNHVFHFTRATSTIWKNCDRILCKYVIVMCTCIGQIHLLAILCFLNFFFTPQCPNV